MNWFNVIQALGKNSHLMKNLCALGTVGVVNGKADHATLEGN